MRSITKTFLPPAAATAGPIVIGLSEQAAFATPAISPAIWFYIAGIGAAWFLGTLWADWWSPQSHLRAWWRDWTSFGNFQPISHSVVYSDRGPNHGGRRAEVRIATTFVLRRRSQVRDLRITVVKHYLFGSNLNPEFQKHTYRPALTGNYEAGDSIEIPLAFIAKDRNHPGYYGDETAPHIGHSMEFLFTIEIFSGRKLQELRLYLRVPTGGDVSSPPDCHYGDRYFLIAEGYDPLNAEPFSRFES